MAVIAPYLIEFINKHIVLIEKNAFAFLYEQYEKDNRGRIRLLTHLLLEAGINPLEYCVSVPNAYLFQSERKIPQLLIPNKVMRIKEYAFCQTSIDEIYIPNSVKIIDNFAFASNNFSYIGFRGTAKEFDDILKSKNAFVNCGQKVIHCIDGDYVLYG